MAAIYDPKIFEDLRKKDMNDFAEILETYIRQEDFTHPGLYALLRLMDPPHELIEVVSKMGDRLKVKGCAPDYYAMINRIMKERLYTFLVAYHKGLATEAEAIFAGKERDSRTKVMKTKSWKDKFNVRGITKKDDSVTETTTTDGAIA